MKTEIALAVASVGMALSVAFPFPAQAGEIEDRFVYVGCGLGNREKVDKTIDVVRRAAKLGFNGLVLQGDIQYAWMAPEHERKNLARLKVACDEAGMDLLVKAGFDPAGSVTSMKKLRAIENEYNKYEISSVFSDHPETQKRIDYLTARAVRYGSKPEDLEVKPFDDPAAIGKVAKILADLGGVEASLTIKAAYGDKFVVKKMLYDDASKTAKPVKVADAVSMASGRYVTLLLTPVDVYEKADIAVGDGIYLEPETEEAETPADSGEERGKKE